MYSSQKRANIALRKRGLLAWHPFNWKQYEHEVVNRLTAVIKKIFRCIYRAESPQHHVNMLVISFEIFIASILTQALNITYEDAIDDVSMQNVSTG